MRIAALPVLVAIAVSAMPVAGQVAQREPHIGYLYPAGAQRGTTVQVTVGGQFLKGASDVHVTGEGVRAEIIQYCRPLRNLQKEQREALQAHFRDLKHKLLAELPEDQRERIPKFPGERFGRKAPGKETKSSGDAEMAAQLPDHPLLVKLESADLRKLLHVAHELFNLSSVQKRQPNMQIAESVVIAVTVDRNAAPTDRELRLVTPLGLTNPMCLQVGSLPESDEREPNAPGRAVELPGDTILDLPVLLNGQIMPGDVDRFRIRAKSGQKLVIETHARHLVPYLADAVPGWFQATVALFAEDGTEVAFADDFRFNPDPVLYYNVPEDGVYELEIHDAIYRGREDFVYRVAVSEQPFITGMFPLGTQAGTKTVATVVGWNLPRRRVRLDSEAGQTGIGRTGIWQKGAVSNLVPYAVDELREHMEAEPNNSADSAQRLELPLVINGRIAWPGDVDVFAFDGRAGDTVVAETFARRLNSPVDSVIRLIDAPGNVLALNDDFVDKEGHLHRGPGLLTHHADSYLTARLPADGRYFVQVSDTQEHGSPIHAYRLRVGPQRPRFALRATPASVTVPAGGVAPITIHVLRLDGFEGAVDIGLEGAPEGFVLSGNRVPASRNLIRITLAAPPKGPDKIVSLRLVGRADVAGKALTAPVVPADNVMQAFLWRHLAPARELIAAIGKPKFRALPVQLADGDRAVIPAGGSARVVVPVPKFAKKRPVIVELHEPPEGVSLTNLQAVPKGYTFDLVAERGTVEPGYADNLIVEVFTEYAAKPHGKAPPQKRRSSVGFLPAIPIEIVKGDE